MKYIVTIAAVLIVTIPIVTLAQEHEDSASEHLDGIESMPGTHTVKHDHRKMKGLPSSINSKATDKTKETEQKDNAKKHDHRKAHKHQL